MRIKRVTALAYLHLLEEQKIKTQVALEHFLWKGKLEHLIKTGCTTKKSQFFYSLKILKIQNRISSAHQKKKKNIKNNLKIF